MATVNDFAQRLLAEFNRIKSEKPKEKGRLLVTPIGPPEAREACRVVLEGPAQTYTTIHFDSNRLRFITLEAEEQKAAALYPHPGGGLGVFYNNRILDAKETAELIVQEMSERVNQISKLQKESQSGCSLSQAMRS